MLVFLLGMMSKYSKTHPNNVEIKESIDNIIAQRFCAKDVGAMAGEDIVPDNIQRRKGQFTKVICIDGNHGQCNCCTRDQCPLYKSAPVTFAYEQLQH